MCLKRLGRGRFDWPEEMEGVANPPLCSCSPGTRASQAEEVKAPLHAHD